jgi:hypothetical protein
LGFKTKLVDVLDLPGFTELLHRKKVRVIQMQRRNRVKAVISRINAARLHEASGKWNLYDESDRLPPLEVDIAQFDQYLKERIAADDESWMLMSTPWNCPGIKLFMKICW